VWPPALRWIPTSTDRIIAAEKRLLSIVKYGLAPSLGFPPSNLADYILHANRNFRLLTGTGKLVTFSWTGTATHLCGCAFHSSYMSIGTNSSLLAVTAGHFVWIYIALGCWFICSLARLRLSVHFECWARSLDCETVRKLHSLS